MNGLISPAPLLTLSAYGCVRVCVSSCEATEWLFSRTLLSQRAHPPTPSSWPCTDASQRPLHSLTLLSPSSHGPARQNPAIVSSCGVQRLANSPAHTHMHYALHGTMYRWIWDSSKAYLNLQHKTYCTSFAHIISRCLFLQAEQFSSCSHCLPSNHLLSVDTENFIKPKAPVYVYSCLCLLL